VLNKNKILEEGLDRHLKMEILTMWKIKHPYIVQLHKVLATQHKILLVMEYMQGGDLFDFIRSDMGERLSEEKSRKFFQQIIMAIDYCHNLNIIHRDLKPENILIDLKNDCVKVTDFGLCTNVKHRNEILKETAGTTNYFSPEVISQTGYLGPAADIWSAGVILYNCVTGCKKAYNLLFIISYSFLFESSKD
jgi:serine/threonine protein kinase